MTSEAPSEWLTPEPFTDEDLPPGTYVFEGEDTTEWVPLSSVRPDLEVDWRAAFTAALRDFVGRELSPEEAAFQPTFQFGVDGVPRELRALTVGDSWWDIVLWEGVNVPLWIEELALQHSQRIRFGERGGDDGESDDDDEEDWPDEESLSYTRLEETHPEIAGRVTDRYTDLFLRFSKTDASHGAEVHELFELSVSHDVAPPLVQATSRITGQTTWLYEWDQSEHELLRWVENLAVNHAMWCDTERRLNGPLAWD